ncbi:MAG: 4,5:9,10-diseco-3-hydroxy-5,9,17-trioxoandrosta-1(10),2-diene-4-oate hydrolase [Marmoricola sp.]
MATTQALSREDLRHETDLDGVRIVHYEAGEGGALGGGLPLVMLHGGGPGSGSWSNFGPCLPRFAESFRTVMVDQPGFGESDKPDVEGNYYRFSASYVLRLLDRLGIEKVHLLGNSLGGGTAMRLALMHPDRVGRLVLMGPGGLSLNLFHADPTEGVARLMDFGKNPSEQTLRAFVSTLVVNQGLVTDELVAERFAAATAPGAQHAMAQMGASFWNPETAEDGMLWREAHRLQAPTLLTWGREDRVNPLDGAVAALKLMPRASLHVFPNCGHWAQLEKADEFAEVATAFLSRHKEGR